MKNRSAEVTGTYRVLWNDGSAEGTLTLYQSGIRKTRADLTYQRSSGATAIRTLILDGTFIYYCASDGATQDAGDSNRGCISRPMPTLQVEAPTTKERGIAVLSRTMKTVGGQQSTCFNVDRGGETRTTWNECYADDGKLTYADGEYVLSLVQSLEVVQVPDHPVDSFSAARSMEGESFTTSVDPQRFVPPYPSVPG